MKILILVAGTNNPSNCDILADMFAKGLKPIRGIQITKLYIRDLNLEHFSLKFYKPRIDQGGSFRKLREQIEESDGIVIAAPIWNFSVPAHLKNLIDRMGSFALDANTHSQGRLHHKPFFFLYTGGAPTPVWKGVMRFTVMHVSESIRYFGGTVVGMYYEPKCMPRKGSFELVANTHKEGLQKVKKKGERFGHFVRRYKETGRLPLYNRIIHWMYLKAQIIAGKL